MRKYLFLLVMLLAYCLSGFAQSQTKTATLLNYNLHRVYITNYPRNTVATSVAFDDGNYASTNKLSTRRGASLLVLQGFQFNIPTDATIENIAVKARRFKTGNGEVKDRLVRLVMRRERPDLPEWWDLYGDTWADPNYFPAIESEVNYSQTGSGVVVIGDVSKPYQWTPARINDLYFGVMFQTNEINGDNGASVFISYDHVEITVEYSIPEARTRKSPDAAETKPLKEPIIYPNPFTTKSNIQFIAAETGSAVVELYNITGVKIRTLFSANVIQGQTYNVAAGDAQLPKGVYVYMIRNGKQSHTGRIIKLEQ